MIIGIYTKRSFSWRQNDYFRNDNALRWQFVSMITDYSIMTWAIDDYETSICVINHSFELFELNKFNCAFNDFSTKKIDH